MDADKKMLTIGRAIHRNFQFANVPELLAFKIILQEDVDGIRKVRAVERNTDKEESHVEDWFPFGKGDLTLVKTRWSTDFTESGDKTVESTTWTSDDECFDAVVEGDAKFRVVREIFVRRSDMTFQVLETQPDCRQHWAGDTLSTLDRVGNNAWLKRDDGESNLRTRNGEEEPLHGLL